MKQAYVLIVLLASGATLPWIVSATGQPSTLSGSTKSTPGAQEGFIINENGRSRPATPAETIAAKRAIAGAARDIEEAMAETGAAGDLKAAHDDLRQFDGSPR